MTKDEIAVIFTTYSDEEIGNLGINFDALVYENFSFEEIEKLLLRRLEKFSVKEAALIAEKLFDEYNSLYQSSYLDEPSNHQEEFAASFLKSNSFRNTNTCLIWPDLLCTTITEGCIERTEEDFTILRAPCVRRQITGTDCGRQPNTPDCDYNYHWGAASADEYLEPEKFQFYWWTNDVVYRFFSNSNINGFANIDVDNRLTCFLGERHRIAFNTAWFFDDCPHEQWINHTRFGSILRETGAECGVHGPQVPLSE